MNSILAFIFAPLIRVSPFVIKKLTPILLDTDVRLWKAAYPLAVGIVLDLADNGKIDGWDKHKVCVQQLKAAVLATGKFELGRIKDLHLGQIVLAAYADELGLSSPAVSK